MATAAPDTRSDDAPAGIAHSIRDRVSVLANALAVVAFLIALTWLFSGLAEIVVGLQTAGSARILYLILGGLSFVIGLIFLFAPQLSLAALVVMTGISAIVIGVGEMALALRLRQGRV